MRLATRLSSLLRPKISGPALRAGVPPTWDRPDPPATKRTSLNRRYTMEQKHFYLNDGSSPTYMVVNPEVAIGDLGEAFPFFIKNVAALLLAGVLFGYVGYLYSSNQQYQVLHNFDEQVQQLERQKKHADQKYGLKDLINNPWKLNAWPEVYPKTISVIEAGNILTNEYYHKSEALEKVRKVNKEALAYWNTLYSECQADLKSQKEKGGAHGHH